MECRSRSELDELKKLKIKNKIKNKIMPETSIKSEAQEIIDESLDYTLFSWSKQKGINPIAVERAEGVYLYDYNGKKYLDFSSGSDECKYWPWKSANNHGCYKANARGKLCYSIKCYKSSWKTREKVSRNLPGRFKQSLLYFKWC